jgi:hypothetical protein
MRWGRALHEAGRDRDRDGYGRGAVLTVAPFSTSRAPAPAGWDGAETVRRPRAAGTGWTRVVAG